MHGSLDHKNNTDPVSRVLKTGRAILAAAFVFSVFINLLVLTGPLFMLLVYDTVLTSGSEETLVALIGLVALLYALMALLDFARGALMARLGARLQTALERHVFEADMAHHRPAIGLADLEAVHRLLASPGLLALFDLLWVPLFLGALFLFHPLLGGLGLIGALILIGLSATNHWHTRKAGQITQQSSMITQNLAMTACRTGPALRAQGLFEGTVQRWSALRNQALLQSVKKTDHTGALTAATKAFRLFMPSAILALGAWLVLQGSLSAGAMIAASILLGRGLAPMELTLAQWPTTQRGVSAWKALRISINDQASETTHRVALPRPTATLCAHHIAARPPNQAKPSLQGVSFELHAGEALGVIGPSGCGKSTLAHVLTGVWPLLHGQISLDHAAMTQHAPSDLANYIGYLPQDPVFLPGTIAENIARFAPHPDDNATVKAAKAAHVHEMILSFPDGYNTQLSDGGCGLSGGQKQRIALARAFYGDPFVIILDEPNSALDAEGSAGLSHAIRTFKASGGVAVIMTHRPLAITECDRLLVLEKGHVRDQGPRDTVLKTILRNAPQIGRALGGETAA